jgi:hypothetical protein
MGWPPSKKKKRCPSRTWDLRVRRRGKGCFLQPTVNEEATLSGAFFCFRIRAAVGDRFAWSRDGGAKIGGIPCRKILEKSRSVGERREIPQTEIYAGNYPWGHFPWKGDDFRCEGGNCGDVRFWNIVISNDGPGVLSAKTRDCPLFACAQPFLSSFYEAKSSAPRSQARKVGHGFQIEHSSSRHRRHVRARGILRRLALQRTWAE